MCVYVYYCASFQYALQKCACSYSSAGHFNAKANFDKYYKTNKNFGKIKKICDMVTTASIQANLY